MAVDRIQKIGKENPENRWKVAATLSTKDEKHQNAEGDADSEEERQAQDSFGETSDFIHLLEKDPRRLQQKRLEVSKIESFIFRGINTHRDQALLEVDIAMKDGHLLQGAQIALNRQESIPFMSSKMGEALQLPWIAQQEYFEVTLPREETSFLGETRRVNENTNTAFILDIDPEAQKFGALYYFGLAVLLIALATLIYIFTTV